MNAMMTRVLDRLKRVASVCVAHGAGKLAMIGVLLSLCGTGCDREPAMVSRPAEIDIHTLIRQAQTGDSDAQQALGEAYASGRGTAPNYPEAVKWLSQSALQGNPQAQYLLGQMHEAGQGTNQSYQAAATWFRKAAELGHAPAQYSLAVLYAFGRGVRLDDAEAARWYRTAAEQGEALAQFNLGQRYQGGRGLPADPIEAYKWLSLAAKEIPDSAAVRDALKPQLTGPQRAEAERRIREYAARDRR